MPKTDRPPRPATRLRALAALLALCALAACSDSSTEPDAGDAPSDTSDATVDVGDTDESDVSDVGADGSGDAGPTRCVPGQTRCLLSLAGFETCNDVGAWESTLCEGELSCFEGECKPRICEPFRVDSCTDCRTYTGCNAGGTAEGEWPVPLDRTCDVVGGVAQLVDALCTPGSTRCQADDEDAIEVCGECGQSWAFERNCFAEDERTVCDLGACVPQCEFIRKRQTYIGCEYWAVDLDNALVPGGSGYIDADGKPFAVVLSNPSSRVSANITVSMVDREVYAAVIPPGGLEIVRLHEDSPNPDDDGTPLADLQGTEIDAAAFHVVSDMPIIAYQFNPLDNETVYSNDASLLFPTSSLGDEYWVMTRRQTFDSLKGYVTVIGVMEGETQVTVTLPQYTLENPVITLSNEEQGIPVMRGGDSRTFTLRQFDVLNIETNRPGADLTGTHVKADRVVAVFGGSEASNAPNDDSCVFRSSREDWVCEATRRTAEPVPCANGDGEPDITRCSQYITCCADHLEHQMLPDFAWGRSFVAARSVPRGDEADSWRILASRDDTQVTLRGLPDVWPLPGMLPSPGARDLTLNAGEWVDFQSPVDFEIEATRPVMVGQFLQAEDAPYPRAIAADQPEHTDANTGDPAFILGVPTEQFRSTYTFLAPNAFEFDYVTITAPVGASVLLDDVAIEDAAFEAVGDSGFAVARLQVEDGVHTLSADVPVGLVVHGYDRYVSYGYAGGLDLRDLSADR